jgi:VWFA-related protein
MKKSTDRIVSLLALLLVIYPLRGYSLQRPQKGTERSNVFDVQVLSEKTYQPIGHLEKEDFLIYEDEVKQQVTQFTHDERPLSVVLLLDLSGSMEPRMKEVREMIAPALQGLKLEDEVATMAFSKDVKLVHSFTKDKQLLKEQIEKTYNPSRELGRTQTALHEALYQAAAYLRRASNTENCPTIVVISDGQSNQSGGHTYEEALRELSETGSTVNGLIVPEIPANTLTFSSFDEVLTKYAVQTGGLVLNCEPGPTEYAEKIQIKQRLGWLIGSLRNRYRLAYVSSNSKADRRFHKVKVKLTSDVQKRIGKVLVLNRPGYHALSNDTPEKPARKLPQ